MRSFSFLVNPASGGGAAPDAVVPVARLLREAGATVDVTYSPGPRATDDLVRAAVARGDVVVSVGGDGMLSHLAGAVSEAGGVLGVLPAGRGNDFARMLGLPGEPDAIARILLEAPERPVDLLRLTAPGEAPRLVAGSVYSGVDARAAEIVDAMRWTPKKLQYPLAAVRAILTYSPGRFRVSVDGSTQEYAAATVVVANSGYYGKGMHIAPDAAVDDGLLDVVVVEAASRSALVRSFPKIYDGSHVGLDEVHVLRGTRVEVAADGVRPIAVGGDGEPLGTLPGLAADPSVVELVPGALRVLF
ncbi:MAG: diacylglycerol kinase family protein [Actinomycetota bacterium]|nr:diacylglycerol kinase family protein [Actinomycetota bacterium]